MMMKCFDVMKVNRSNQEQDIPHILACSTYLKGNITKILHRDGTDSDTQQVLRKYYAHVTNEVGKKLDNCDKSSGHDMLVSPPKPT